MITKQEAAHGLFGAWRLLHLDASGLQHFQTTRAAFWNSFWAMAVVLPASGLQALLLTIDQAGDTTAPASLHTTLVYIETFVIGWLAFPLVMAAVAEAIQRGERFVLFVVAWNWSNIVRVAIILPAATIFAAEGVENAGWGAALYLFAQLATLAYAWAVARIALNISPLTALMVVLIEIGLSITVWLAAQSLIG